MSGRAPTSGGVRRYSFYTPGEQPTATAAPTDAEPAAASTSSSHANAPPTPTLPTAEDEPGPVRPIAEDPSAAANGGEAAAGSADANADADTNASATGTANHDGSTGGGAAVQAQQRAQGPSSPAKVVYSFYSSGDLDAMLQVAQQPLGGGGEKENSQEQSSSSSSRGHRPLKPRPAGPANVNDEDEGIVVDDVVGEDGVGPEVVEGGTQEADEPAGDAAATSTSAAAPPAEPLGLESIAHSDDDDDDDDDEEIYQHEEYQEEEGENTESILRKLSLEEERGSLRTKEESNGRQLPAQAQTHVHKTSASAEILRGLQQTPRHRNVGVGIDVGANDANAMCKANADDCGKQSQQRLPPPVMVTNGGSNADLTASPAITTAAAAIDAFGVLAEGNDYGAARSLSEIPEAQVEVMTADGGGDGASSSSAEDIVWDALRLVRQRAAERRQLRQHCEETALHQPQHHPQQVMAMTTPTRPQAQVETGRAATDGGERQLEPPLERVGGPAGEGEGGPPPLPPASGLTTVSVPVQQASPGQSSLLTPMADVRKLVSTSSSDMFRPPVEATPGRKAQRATEADARPSLHLAGPVMSTSAMTPGRGPTANAQRAQIPSEGGPDLVSEDEALERGLEMVLTAILEQSRLGRSGYDGGVVGPTNTLDAVVSSLFRGDTGHLTDDRFSRPSRRTSAEIGGGPEHHIQKRSVAEGLLASASPVYDEVALARDSMASPSSMLVESASSPRMTDLSHLDASATATGADVSRASSTSTGGGGGKHRVLGRLSKGMGGRTGIVLSNDAEVDTEEDEDQSFGATVDSQSHAINPLDDGDGSDEESQDIYEDEEHSPKGQDESPPPSPSLLRSFSDKAGLTKSGSSSYDEDDDDEMLQRGASFRGENEEAHALMRILCAHLLPVGLAKSAKKSETPDGAPDKNFGSWLSKGSANLDESDDDQNDEDDSLANPSWDDEDLDEPGYVVHRLSMAQLQRVEKEFQIMINRVRQTSERRLLEGGGTKASSGSASNLSQNKDRAVAAQDDDFERDLEEAEELLDREEQRIQAEQKAAAAASGKQKSASPIPLPRSSTDDNSAADSESSNSSSDKDSDDEDSSDDEESDSTSESGSDVDDSVDMAEWSSPNKEGDDLAMLAGGSAAIPSHLAGNPNFPHVFPSGQGRRGDMELFHLPIIYKAHQTGFEPTKDIVLEPGSIFAGQYLVQNELGSAAFSTAYRCIDLHSGQVDEDGEEYHEEVCLKVIKNTKDFLDQSLDEIKVLELLRRTEQCDQNCLVEMKAFFYHREHLVIVTELLRQNLYEFGKFIMENDEPPYFTRQRLCYITRQSLMALDFIHKLGLIHSDIKPENILLSSYSRAKVKVIDFGSSCYLTDRQSSYIQSRSYRAPEVVLGLPYDGKIDIWSLGCVVAEMYTGLVTFQNDSVVSMLSRIEAICGAFPRHLIAKGRQSGQFFTASGLLYEKADPDEESHDASMSSHEEDSYNIFQPKTTTLAARLGFDPDLLEKTDLQPEEEECAMFVDFVRQLLTIDPDARPTAEEALRHPWILSSYRLTEDDIRYPPEGEESESESEEDD
jgi:serine/threonine protein kinase